jgi:two-component system NtrC family sensor kinase
VCAARVLVVDDSAVALDAIEEALAAKGWLVSRTTAPDQALELLTTAAPEAVVCDLHMPEMNGIELFTRARELAPLVPFIILSGEGDLTAVLEAVHAGVFDFVLKSGDSRTLTAAVGRALRHYQVVSENQRLTDSLRDAKEALERRVEERTRNLQEAQAALVEAARRAGMAEIAAFVLHNVGNVLNHLSVSASRLAEVTEASRVAQLEKAAALLHEHENDLAGYLARDPRGKRLPEYLRLATAALLDQQGALRLESELIGKGLAHVRSIISTQGRYAGFSVLPELVSPRDLLEDALRMNAEGLETAGVQVVRQLAELPPAMLDRHKIVQILLNLISNARHSLASRGQGPRQLTVRMGLEGPGQLLYAVADNGAGIARPDLTRIFDHGFTTRRDGQGLGLHGSANLAAEMRGSLTAHSEGPGHGATFILHVPFATSL